MQGFQRQVARKRGAQGTPQNMCATADNRTGVGDLARGKGVDEASELQAGQVLRPVITEISSTAMDIGQRTFSAIYLGE